MASTDINRLIDNLRVQLPGATDAAIKFEIYNALNDFFQKSSIWREDISIAVTAGRTNYDLTPSGPAKVFQLMGVVDANEFPVTAQIDLNTEELIVAQTPSSDTTYIAQVALTVNDPVDREGYPVFPMWVLNVYSNEIMSGVLARMMAQPAKPYSNTQLAIYHNRAFSIGTANARVEAARGLTYGTQKWRFPQQFNRRKTYR